MKKNVGILIYNDVEILDFTGPFEVFAVASALQNKELFDVFTIAKSSNPTVAAHGLSVNPTYSLENAPEIDLLILPGGIGSRIIIHDEEVLTWVSQRHSQSLYTASVCSGALILAKLGLLDHKEYCTHHSVYSLMEELVPTGIPKKNKRYQQQGKMFTSAGISAGIDLSLHMVAILHGEAVAKATPQYMEYTPNN